MNFEKNTDFLDLYVTKVTLYEEITCTAGADAETGSGLTMESSKYSIQCDNGGSGDYFVSTIMPTSLSMSSFVHTCTAKKADPGGVAGSSSNVNGGNLAAIIYQTAAAATTVTKSDGKTDLHST